MVTGRQLDLILDAFLNLSDNAAHICPADIALYDPTPLVLLSIDLDRAYHLYHVGNLGQR
ncbi:unnamed protein product, partial [marine sediment metagenome]